MNKQNLRKKKHTTMSINVLHTNLLNKNDIYVHNINKSYNSLLSVNQIDNQNNVCFNIFF